MASSPESIESAPAGSWTVDKLKEFLRKHNLPVSGIKAVLVSRVRDCLDTAFFEAELNVQPFQQFNCEEVAVPSFESLPLGLWCKENFRMISADAVKEYLQKKVAILRIIELEFVSASVAIYMIWRWPK